MLWDKNGILLEDAAGNILDCDHCPCDDHPGTGTDTPISTCFDCIGFTISSKLRITYTYAGFSKTFPLTLVYNDGITAIWYVIGDPWAPCGTDGPRFNNFGPLTPDQLACSCISSICPLTLDTFIDNAGGSGISHNLSFRQPGCPGEDVLAVESPSPMRITVPGYDLGAIFLSGGDCLLGSFILDIVILKA